MISNFFVSKYYHLYTVVLVEIGTGDPLILYRNFFHFEFQYHKFQIIAKWMDELWIVFI